MAEPRPRDIVMQFIEALNTQNLEGLLALMTEDHMLADGMGSEWQGRDVMRWNWDGFFDWFPDYHITVNNVLEDGNIVAVIGMAEATLQIDGVLPPENHWVIPAAWKAVVRDNLIAEWRVYADNEPARRILIAHNQID